MNGLLSGQKGELTLTPYALDDSIPVAEKTVIKVPQTGIIELDCGEAEDADGLIRYAELGDECHGLFVSRSTYSLQ